MRERELESTSEKERLKRGDVLKEGEQRLGRSRSGERWGIKRWIYYNRQGKHAQSKLQLQLLDVKSSLPIRLVIRVRLWNSLLYAFLNREREGRTEGLVSTPPSFRCTRQTIYVRSSSPFHILLLTLSL